VTHPRITSESPRAPRTVRPRPAPPRGFTLLEVLLVLGILVLIAAIVTPSLFSRQRKALIRVTKASIAGLEAALKLYAAEHEGEYPDGSSAEVFDLLMHPGVGEDGRAITPYLEDPPTDGWGEILYYEYPSNRQRRAGQPAIWSSGPDGKNDRGGQDDINNWDEAGP